MLSDKSFDTVGFDPQEIQEKWVFFKKKLIDYILLH